MAATHAENQPGGDVNNRDQDRPLDVPGFQNGSHERRATMSGSSLLAPESPKGKQQQVPTNHHNYDGMSSGNGGGPLYGRPEHGDQPTGDGDMPKTNNFEQTPPDKDGYPPPPPGGYRNNFGHHQPPPEQHHANSNAEPNSFGQFRHAYPKPMMRVPGPPGAMFPQRQYLSGQSISQPTGPTPTLNQLLQSSNPASRYQNNYGNEYTKPDGSLPPPVQNQQQQHYNQNWPPPRHNMPPFPPQHGMPYRNMPPSANPRGPTPPPSPGHQTHYPPPPSSPTGYQQHHRVPPLHHQYPPGPPSQQQQQSQQPPSHQQVPYGSYPNQQPPVDRQQQQQPQQQPQIPQQPPQQPHAGLGQTTSSPASASPPALPPVSQSQNAQQHSSPTPPPPQSQQQPPHQSPPHVHPQQHKSPGGYQTSVPIAPNSGPGNYLNSMPPHSMGPPAPVQSNTGPPMAPPNSSMMSVDHEVSQQQQSLSGVVTSVVTTGPDGTAIDDASQQSTLSNASAASGDDSNCTTPKRKENMSGNMMYQQGMGGIMGPPCSPAHDEYSNPEPMAPAWPRGPPSHNPVFNSHIPPQNEHVYRPKKHDSLSKLYEMDDNPERRIWLDKLLHFMEERGSPISTCPTISKNPLDLFRLYIYVKERGGFMEVCKVTKNKIWKDVAGLLGIGASSSAAYTLRKHYTKNLLPYECHFDRGGIDPVPIINQVESSSKKKSSKATSVPSPGSAGSNSQDSLPSAPIAPGPGHVDGYPGYGGYSGPQDYNSPQRPPHPPHGTQGSYQGQGGYNQQYPGSNEQYGQHYPPANTPVGYPSGPVRPPLYPPYSNDADRNYGGSVPPPQGPPNTPQGPGNGQDPYGRGPVPPPSSYQQPPRFPGPPPPQNSSPATVNQTQGGSVSTPGYPPGQQPQPDYYRQEPPASPGYPPTSAPGNYPGKGMPPPQPRRHPDFAKDQQAGPPQPAGYPGYGPQQRPMYPGWTGTPNATSNQYPRPGYPPGSQPPQNWSQGPPRSMPPSHPGQPPQWEQHRYPPQGQPYGAQQNHWGPMTQAQMRMPRHGYRPDGSKPYGPHGPMAPPPHLKPGMPGQPIFQGSNLMKREVIFPPDSIEAVTPILYKRRRMMRHDVAPVDAWRLMMSLRSGLLAESTWALDVLNILLFDDVSIPFFGLTHMPGLLDVLLEHFRQSLVDMLETDIKSYCWYEKSKVIEEIPDVGAVVDNVNPNEKAYFPDPTFPNQRPIKSSAIIDGSKELFIKNGKRSWDIIDNYDMGYNIAETDTSFLVPCFRSEFGLVPFVKLLKSDKPKAEILDDKSCINKELNDKELLVQNSIDNIVNIKNINVRDPMGVLKRKSITDYEDESYSKDESSLSLISESQDSIGKRCVCISNILRNLSFVPGNELEFAKSGPFLGLVGKLLLTHHEHPLRSSKTRNYDKADDDTESLFNCTTTTDADTIEPGNDAKWWWDYLEVVRENLLVSLANIAGYVDLSTFNEDISRPILDGLLHWAICPAAAGQDPFPSAPLSPQRLALECLCKLCVTDNNVDLVIATPPYSRLEKLANVLTRLLCRTEEQVLREFSVNLLHYLAAADSGMARTIALQSPCVSLLVAFIEQTEQNALSVVNTHGLNALRDNPDSMGTSLDMLRRAARILLLLSRHPDNRPLFLQQEQRLLSLVMSQILDQQVAALISRVLFQCSRNTPSPLTQ
ncbi:PREDICTED: trithorax group protein osa-like isoform X5 [Diuraphis noxia]|uniref:trithorax group protein osa-like isoform X5 n=1 Tax=Diuraphis noxia TaxID=143948 RepID=UPI0007638657|nr:PREDICTED: trithorax group protein osa-like isoform X5 [Diuraphis noxia]